MCYLLLVFLAIEREVDAEFIGLLVAKDPYEKKQTFALVENRHGDPCMHSVEMYELPSSMRSDTDITSSLWDSQITVYHDRNPLESTVFSSLEEMNVVQSSLARPTLWRMPLTLSPFYGPPVGVLETTWTVSRCSTPPPYASMSEARRCVQSAYVNVDRIKQLANLNKVDHSVRARVKQEPAVKQEPVELPAAPVSPILAGNHIIGADVSPDTSQEDSALSENTTVPTNHHCPYRGDMMMSISSEASALETLEDSSQRLNALYIPLPPPRPRSRVPPPPASRVYTEGSAPPHRRGPYCYVLNCPDSDHIESSHSQAASMRGGSEVPHRQREEYQ